MNLTGFNYLPTAVIKLSPRVWRETIWLYYRVARVYTPPGHSTHYDILYLSAAKGGLIGTVLPTAILEVQEKIVLFERLASDPVTNEFLRLLRRDRNLQII